MRETTIAATGNKYDESVTCFDIIEVKKNEENQYKVNITTEINEVSYFIKCEYDSISNEIFNITYNIQNE